MVCQECGEDGEKIIKKIIIAGIKITGIKI